jgi:acyl-CoA thioesterase
MEELAPDTPRPFPFWDNVESRPVDFVPEWPPSTPLPPTYRSWSRFRPTATFDDPWLDAARAAILVDVQSWPAAHRHHAWQDPKVIAPSLDLYVAFHQPALDEPWLLLDGYSPVAAEGLIGWTGRLWSGTRRLVASGGGQLLCRPTA